MSEVLSLLKKYGQMLSTDIAQHLDLTERTINTHLYPHVAAGRVMACTLIKDGKKSIEYRLSGTIPRARPGPKVGARS